MSDVQRHESSHLPAIQFTAAAENRVLSYLSEHHHKGLRLSVKKTGCSGLSYVLDYVDAPAQGDLVRGIGHDDCFVSIDRASYPYLSGVEIDYVKQGLNQKFVFNNPNQTGQCGCGESFTVSPNEAE